MLLIALLFYLVKALVLPWQGLMYSRENCNAQVEIT